MPLADTFSQLRSRGEKALILFVTGGDPGLDELPAILAALAEGGADVVEIGLPFSDPIADGPTIQASSQRALDRGVSPASILAALAENRPPLPAVAMGYYNTLLRRDLSKAARQFRASGIEGSIISDLTPEESDEWIAASKAEGLSNIFLAAPTSTDARLDEVARRSTGFLYAVSRTGVTGAGQAIPDDSKSLLRRIKERTETPVVAGFGISKPEHVRMACEVADGAVIGSALVDFLASKWLGGQGRAELIDLVAGWKSATR